MITVSEKQMTEPTVETQAESVSTENRFERICTEIDELEQLLHSALRLLAEKRRVAERAARHTGMTEDKFPVFDEIWDAYRWLAALQEKLTLKIAERDAILGGTVPAPDATAPIGSGCQGDMKDDTASAQEAEDISVYYSDDADIVRRELSDRARNYYKICPRCRQCGREQILTLINDDLWWCCPESEPGDWHPRVTLRKTVPVSSLSDKGLEKLRENFKDHLTEAKKRREARFCALARQSTEETERNHYFAYESAGDGAQRLHDYLYQTLALPGEVSNDARSRIFDSYAYFRLLTSAPRHAVDERVRTVFALALRLAARGILVPVYEKTQATLKRLFQNEHSGSAPDVLIRYLQYRHPVMACDSERERKFAETWFPEVLGANWAGFVYSQMPLPLILQDPKQFVDQRVDFFIVRGGKKIVIELDGPEHKQAELQDKQRDSALRKAGCEIYRFQNDEIDAGGDALRSRLTALFPPLSHEEPIFAVGEKMLVACKIVHQTVIALLKALEAGHIEMHANCALQMDIPLFSEREKNILFHLAVEEASELTDHLSALYGAEVDLNLTDPQAPPFTIWIGDGDDSGSSMTVRDTKLTTYHFCQISPFPKNVYPVCAPRDSVEFFLYYVWGYPHFRDGQYEAIRRTLLRQDSIVLLPTGSGKSVIFQLSALLMPGITMVISPLRALIEDQRNNLHSRGIDLVAARFSTDRAHKDDVNRRNNALFESHAAALYYIAPERLQIPEFQESILTLKMTENFTVVAFDEAHCVSEWGHDFRPAYLQAGSISRMLFPAGADTLPFLALTGTASNDVLQDVRRDLMITSPNAILAPSTFDRSELHFAMRRADNSCQKNGILAEIFQKTLPADLQCTDERQLRQCQGSSTRAGIVFVAKRSHAQDLFAIQVLQPAFESITGMYFSKAPDDYKQKQEMWDRRLRSTAAGFKSDRISLLIATKAFGMGIDKPNIRYVIHYDMPMSIEQYYQEVGRAGRDRAPAFCTLIIDAPERNQLSDLLNPNLSYNEFRDKERNLSTKHDLGTALYFHINSFPGTEPERKISDAIIDCLYECVTVPQREDRIPMTVDMVIQKLTETGKKDENPKSDSISETVPKLFVRLSNLGVLSRWEFDYRQSTYYLTVGSVATTDIILKYAEVVGRYDTGRVATERERLKRHSALQGKEFVKTAMMHYIQFVYAKIETGRRRALYNMVDLAIRGSEQPTSAQDRFIRKEIQNYLAVKNALTERILCEGEPNCGFAVIEEYFPFTLNGTVSDGAQGEAERAFATETKYNAARVLENNPFHPGLLFTRAIACVRSGVYNPDDVINDTLAAYRNAKTLYGVPDGVRTTFMLRVVNLFFNDSPDVGYRLMTRWDSEASEARDVLSLILKSGAVCQNCKDYFMLRRAGSALEKLIGGTK